MKTEHYQEFEAWWGKICPDFDPITSDHVLMAWSFQQERIEHLRRMIKVLSDKFPVESGLEDDELSMLNECLLS